MVSGVKEVLIEEGISPEYILEPALIAAQPLYSSSSVVRRLNWLDRSVTEVSRHTNLSVDYRHPCIQGLDTS